jgi:hypothetical protein
MFGWWRRRKESQANIEIEAAALIAEHGDGAYPFARDRALEYRLYKVVDPVRAPEHWDRVRFAIRKLQGKGVVDTATRYLENQ